MKTLAFLIAGALLFACCQQEDTLSDHCTTSWSRLEDVRTRISLPEGTWWNPRILGNRVWYSSSDNVAGVSWDDGSIKVVPKPKGMNIYNPGQRDVSYTGTDRTSLFCFDWENFSWKNLHTPPSGIEIDDDIDSEVMEGLLPFVQRDKADNSQTVWIYDFDSDQAYEVLGLSKLYMERPFQIYTQPKVFLDKSDTLLATVVQFSTETNRSVLVFSLKKGRLIHELPLGYGQYRDAYRLEDKLGIRYLSSFYHDIFAVIDPKNGQLLWNDGACSWLSRNGDLFSLDCLFGFNRKVKPETGETDYFISPGNDLYSLDGLIEGNYVIPGRVTADTLTGPLNHIVFVNREKGCEVKRLPLPDYASVLGKLTCLPDSNWIIIQDVGRSVRFLRLK